jgi:hypothetical protein
MISRSKKGTRLEIPLQINEKTWQTMALPDKKSFLISRLRIDLNFNDKITSTKINKLNLKNLDDLWNIWRHHNDYVSQEVFDDFDRRNDAGLFSAEEEPRAISAAKVSDDDIGPFTPQGSTGRAKQQTPMPMSAAKDSDDDSDSDDDATWLEDAVLPLTASTLSQNPVKFYIPLAPILDPNQPESQLAERLYVECLEYNRNGGNKPVISPVEFESLYESSIQESFLVTQQDRKNFLGLLNEALRDLPDNTVILADAEIPNYSLIQTRCPRDTDGAALVPWSVLFNGFETIRVSTETKRTEYVSLGRVQGLQISTALNNGGCGLAALLVMGHVTYGEYLAMMTNSKFISAATGTTAHVLFRIMLWRGIMSHFPRGGVDRDSIRVRRWFVDYNDPTNARLEQLINDLYDLLEENCATILRYGDAIKRGRTYIRQIDETEFGHSVVIFKEEGELYFYDAWLAAMLTVRNPDKPDPGGDPVNAVTSLNAVFARKAWRIDPRCDPSPKQVFTAKNMHINMAGQDHKGMCVFEVYTRLESENVIGEASRARATKSTVVNVLGRGAISQTPRLDRPQRIDQAVRRAAVRFRSLTPQGRRNQQAGVVAEARWTNNTIVLVAVGGFVIGALAIVGLQQVLTNLRWMKGGRKIKKNITRKMKSKKIKQKRLNLKNKTKKIKHKTRKYKR